jgi:hypothetical protein
VGEQMIANQMQFKAYPYKVEVWEGDVLRHSLDIQDATGTFRSIELDDHSQATTKAMKRFESIHQRTSKIIEEKKDKSVEDLTEDERKLFIELEGVNRDLSRLAVKYITLTVKEWDKHKDFIDSIKSSVRNDFFACIRMASFGLTTDTETSKKKLQPMKSATEQDSSDLKGGVIKKKRSKIGTRSK